MSAHVRSRPRRARARRLEARAGRCRRGICVTNDSKRVGSPPAFCTGTTARCSQNRGLQSLPKSRWRSASAPCVRCVTRRASRQPACDRARDREPDGDQAVAEVTLRPRAAARRGPATLGSRGKKPASVRRRRTRSRRVRPRRDGASQGTDGLRSDRDRTHP